jgi:hypothetical protein
MNFSGTQVTIPVIEEFLKIVFAIQILETMNNQ